ncbi:MAG: ATP-binding protein [Atribacterota bacterium]|nr:ATP-binding protein [Atribacterota bacterium]
MRKSRFFKLSIIYIIVIALLSLIALILLTSSVKNQYINNKVENMTHLSTIIEKTVKPFFIQQDWSGLDEFITEISRETGTRITIIHINGQVIAESEKESQEMESHINRPEIKTALEGKQTHIVRYSTTTREDMLYFSTPIRLEKNIIAAIRLSTFLDEMQDIFANLRSTILLISIILMLFFIGISSYVSKIFTIPTGRLLQAFDRVGYGNLETRIIFQQQGPEIKELYEGFNKMAEKLQSFVSALSMQTEELDAIISTIASGIVLLDNKGKIILYNSQFRKDFYQHNMGEKYFWEVIRDSKLNKKVSELIEKKNNFTTEIDISGKDYLCTGTYIEKKDKSVLIFNDITRSKKLALIKKNLITNISHELRTPLTSIKGYIETMEGATDIEKEKYIQVIKRNTERLISMVDDLLVLSELEDKGGKLQIEKIDLKELMTSIVKIFRPSIKDKQLKLVMDIQDDIPNIEADIYKLEQLFINLIDNAIKYTEKGEIIVSINLLTANKVQIKITDTGIGIKEEDVSRIFERFYVVNKARSRQQGGTGLGLSIVKHIVMLHKGEIRVDSRLGLGTRFIITLPVYQT